MSKLYYGFFDESGILEKTAGAGNFFIISVLLIGELNELKRVMKLAKRRTKKGLKTHKIFKAQKEDKGFIKLVLRELAVRNVQIVFSLWDKDNAGRNIDKNSLYGELVAQTVGSALELFPRLNLVIHKRYTSPQIRAQISQKIISVIKEGEFLSIEQKTEIECRELELADAVAWAIFQKFNNKNSEFYEIIKSKIIKENRLTA